MTGAWVLQSIKDNLARKSLNEKESGWPVEEWQRRGMGTGDKVQAVSRDQDPEHWHLDRMQHGRLLAQSDAAECQVWDTAHVCVCDGSKEAMEGPQ